MIVGRIFKMGFYGYVGKELKKKAVKDESIVDVGMVT